MSRLSRFELIEPYHCRSHLYPSFFLTESSSIFASKILALPFPSFSEEEEDDFGGLDLFGVGARSNGFEVLDSVTDLILIEEKPAFSSYRRIQRVEMPGNELLQQSLSKRVGELESKLDRLVNARISGGVDRKYTWTKEIKGSDKYGVDRKYKWTAEIKNGKEEKEKEKPGKSDKKYQWTAEIDEKGEEGPILRTYKFEASSGEASESSGSKKEKEKEKKKKKSKKAENKCHVIEIEEPDNRGVVVLRQAFSKRAGASIRGKKKDLSPQDAAMMIQISFRAYLIRRSQSLRAIRDLAVAKTKLKEIRALFNNISYHRLISRDPAENQRFSEKIIVLRLTVDAIEGVDMMVRAAKRSMVQELEGMLNAVDPQPLGKSGSIRRRTFDMPNGSVSREIAAGVAQVVQMLDEAENSSEHL